MSTEKLEVVAAVVAMVGFVGCLVALRGLIRERDEWRGCAGALAGCVRGLDALPLVEEGFEWMQDCEIRVEGGSMLRTPRERPVLLEPDCAPLMASGRPGYARLPMPPTVAVVGRSAQLDRWSLGASHALRRYDLLLEPEDGR